jgi:lipopolysaccharide/colanic/teichoic acid biosynthesis glycosyltransferase
MNLTVINQPRILPHNMGYQIAKRMLDLTLCLLALPFILPVLAICALAIYLDSSGPVFFIQERVGKGGRVFRIYKFRTMQYNVDDSSHRTYMKAYVRGQIGKSENINNYHRAFVKAFVTKQIENKSRKEAYKPFQVSQVTRVGRILRKTSLDELPQLINVIRGEMSLVGPRPNVPWEVEEYQPWHHERLEVLPGITGLAQVRGRSSINFDSIVNYDIQYIENQSVITDIKILWWTLTAVLHAKGSE